MTLVLGSLLFAWIAAGDTIGDFEGKLYDPWVATGAAFGAGPYRPNNPNRFLQRVGAGIAYSGRSGPEAQGELLSPEFRIERAYVNFRVAGERSLPGVVGVELLVDGKVVRSSSATEAFDPSQTLHHRTWRMADLVGRTARIRVNDHSPHGSIAIDAVQPSDEAAALPCDATVRWHESHRPQFHYTPEAFWMNDPNGLCWNEGTWHLFHQHRPTGSPVAWGHAVSTDLLHWQHRPTAIPPDGTDAIFSGSGLIDYNNVSQLGRDGRQPMLLFYTLHPAAPPRGSNEAPRKATQCLAYSHDGGQSFAKFPGNPLLRTADSNDRDPKVFYHAPSRAWIMLLSLSRNNTARDKATYGLYRSTDLKNWELKQEIGPGAWYWECPDLFELPIDGERGQSKWLLVKSSGEYIIGRFDGYHFTSETEPIRNRWGGCYYATQTFNNAPAGRRIQMAWMSTGKPNAPVAYPGMPFNQQLSFPRELTLRRTPNGLRLDRYPISAIRGLYAGSHEIAAGPLAPGQNPCGKVLGDCFDVDLLIEPESAARIIFRVRGVDVVYDVKQKTLKLPGGAAPVELQAGRLELRLLVDRTSIEAFAHRGAADLSTVFFGDPDDRHIALRAEGGTARVHRLVIHTLRSIYEP